MFRLRELERKDIPIINQWRNDPELIMNLGAVFRFINPDVDSLWYDNYMKTRNNSVRCAIINDDSDEIIGLVSLMNIDHINQCAEFHIMIGSQENQNQGAGTFAVNAMLNHAFMNLNLHRVYLSCNVNNNRAQHVYEKIGFIREGLRRKARFKNGKFIDVIDYGILREDYFVMRNITEWGGANYVNLMNIKSFWLSCVQGTHEISHVVEECDDAFDSPVFASKVSMRKEYHELLNKWNTCAEVFCVRDIEIKGYIVVYANDYVNESAFISMLGVRPKYQRQNCGKYLINACEDFARWKNMKRISLEVHKNNLNGLGFYEHLGFMKESELEESYIYGKRL